MARAKPLRHRLLRKASAGNWRDRPLGRSLLFLEVHMSAIGVERTSAPVLRMSVPTKSGHQTNFRQRSIVATTTNGAKADSRSVGRDSPESSRVVQVHTDEVTRSSRRCHNRKSFSCPVDTLRLPGRIERWQM